MDIYKEGTRQNITVPTTKGEFGIPQLWQIDISIIASCIKKIKKQLKSENDDDDDLSFLDETSTKKVDRRLQLTFEILKDIYITRRDEEKVRQKLIDDKLFNEEIMRKIKLKQEEEIGKKSIDELMGMLR